MLSAVPIAFLLLSGGQAFRGPAHAEMKEMTIKPDQKAEAQKSNKTGSLRGRVPAVAAVAQPACDWQCYLNKNPDLQNVFGKNNVGAAAIHFENHGKDEFRDCTCSAAAFTAHVGMTNASVRGMTNASVGVGYPGLVGQTIALHNAVHNRFMRLNGETADTSDTKGANELPDDWTWERFKVVNAGNGQVALYNQVHKRYLRMHTDKMDGSGTKDSADQLPCDWTWERFTVIDTGDGNIALHNTMHNRFARVNGNKMDCSDIHTAHNIPGGWSWERQKVVVDVPGTHPPGPVPPVVAQPPVHCPLLVIGQTVAFHNVIHMRYARLRGKSADGSDQRRANDLPGGWQWERFKVVDAGGGQVALWSRAHNRYLRMHGNYMDGSAKRGENDLPGGWTWERFTPVAVGAGNIALHNTVHNRFMRLNGKRLDCGPHNRKKPKRWEFFFVVRG